LLWGSDWPHPQYFKPMPNDVALLDMMLDWVPDAATRKLIFHQTFGDRFDRASVVAALHAHEADVIASVPPGELLVFEVGDGWEPLCEFLGLPVPDAPFPRTNSTAEFRVWTGLDRPE